MRLDALTSLRFFLAMMVVCGHFVGHFNLPVPNFVYGWGPNAVAFFFVLSGYIISYSYPSLNTNKDRLNFIVLRIARLWPVHATILTIGLLSGLYWPSNPLMWLRPIILFQFTLTHSWSLSGDIAGGYNGPAWSISDEFFFYLAYVGLAAPSRLMRWAVGIGTIGVGVIAARSHGCMTGGTTECNYWIGMFPPARIVEFIGGVIFFRLKLRVPQVLGLVAALIPIFNLLPLTVGPEWGGAIYNEVVLIAGAGLLISSLAQDGWLSRLLSSTVLIFGGEISYSIYMVHGVINQAVLPKLDGWSIATTLALTLGLTLIASSLLFLFIESPARAMVKRMLKTKRSSMTLGKGELPGMGRTGCAVSKHEI